MGERGGTYRCGAAVRVRVGRSSVDALLAGRVTALRHRNAFMMSSRMFNSSLAGNVAR
jgi:hypothetical protein